MALLRTMADLVKTSSGGTIYVAVSNIRVNKNMIEVYVNATPA